jgi:hypothetical protein
MAYGVIPNKSYDDKKDCSGSYRWYKGLLRSKLL